MDFSMKDIEAILDNLFDANAEEAQDNAREQEVRRALKRGYDQLKKECHIDRMLSEYEVMLDNLSDDTGNYYELALKMATLDLILSIVNAEFFREYMKENWPQLYEDDKDKEVVERIASQKDFFSEMAKLREEGDNEAMLTASLAARNLSRANSVGDQLERLYHILEHQKSQEKGDKNSPGLIIPQSN